MPRRVTVALGFDPELDEAPRLLASGSGRMAEEILRVAGQSGRPVVTDSALAELLNQLPVGNKIPDNLYRAVAAIFAMVLEVDGKMK